MEKLNDSQAYLVGIMHCFTIMQFVLRYAQKPKSLFVKN